MWKKNFGNNGNYPIIFRSIGHLLENRFWITEKKVNIMTRDKDNLNGFVNRTWIKICLKKD